MIHDIKQLDDFQVFINRVEQKLILIQVQFADALPVSFQLMITPTCSEHEERAVIMKSEEINGFRSGFQDSLSSTLNILLCYFLKALRWKNNVAHRLRISPKSSFEDE